MQAVQGRQQLQVEVAVSVEEQIIDLVERLRPAVVSEVRELLAAAVAGVAQDVDEDGMEALALDGCGQPVPMSTFDVGSFVEGMQFAARLFADETFDY